MGGIFNMSIFSTTRKKLSPTHQAEPHAEPEQSAHVGDEAGPGHLLVPDDLGGEGVLDVHVQPQQVALGVVVQHLAKLGGDGVADLRIVAETTIITEQK